MSAVTPAMARCLAEMIEAESEERFEDAEIVCDGQSCWLGDRRVRRQTVTALLRLVAISDRNDGGSVERYAINSVGRSIHADPTMATSVAVAIMRGGGFTIVDGKIEPFPAKQAGAV